MFINYILLCKVGVAHVLHVDGGRRQIGDHFGELLLLVGRQSNGLDALHHVTMEVESVAGGETAQQLHERLTAHLL